MRTPVPLGMPLHAGSECLAVPDPHCFYDPVRGAGFNGQVVSEVVYALFMHAVYPDCFRRGQFPQFAVRFKNDVMGVGEALFDAPVFRREVIQLARQAGYVLVQGAPRATLSSWIPRQIHNMGIPASITSGISGRVVASRCGSCAVFSGAASPR